MKNLKILNTRDIKEIMSKLEKQFGFKEELDYAFLKSDKSKIYLVTKDLARIDLERLNINSIGLYFATLTNNKIRLSIEGSQLIGPKSTKNVIEVNKKQRDSWLYGEDLDYKGKEKGFVIIKHKDDFLGCGKVKKDKILNYVPKSRRISM